MATADKTKAAPAAKAEKPAAAATPEAKTETKTETKSETKSEGSDAAAKPASYSRGEGQKAVTQAYKDNWNLIFGKKKKTSAKTATKKAPKKKSAKKAAKPAKKKKR